jgi:release factor glutamine methyltransferase
LRKKLVEKGDDSPDNTSLLLISHRLNKPKTWALAHGDHILTADEINALQNCATQYLQGVPLPYILGEWEFFGRQFKLTPAVLIPRPETELLVELAIAYGQNKEPLLIVDVGTGSGIIAISLVKALPHADVLALDLSREALDVAKENAKRHTADRVKFVQSDLITPFQTQFNLICANLPYIPSKTLNSLKVAHWEPTLALDGGASGLSLIDRLLKEAQTQISPGGCILLEIESTLGKASLKLAQQVFPVAHHQIHQDLSGNDRVLHIQLP